MCTLTFSPTRTGYLLAMNRDEQRSRERALPPRWHRLGERSALYPHESGGGTWIGLNDTGISFALLNGYSVPLRSLSHPLSRGIVIPALLHGTTSDGADSLLRQLETGRLQPFRLVGIFPSPGSPAVHEWRWDGNRIERLEWGWQRGHWISSAKDEIRSQRTRSACFQNHEAEADVGSDAWLRRLYASHEPEEGPYSICMHRADAVTVSHTRIEVQGSHGRMRYVDGPPCQCASPVHVTGTSLDAKVDPDASVPVIPQASTPSDSIPPKGHSSPRGTESHDLVSYEVPAEAGSFWQ